MQLVRVTEGHLLQDDALFLEAETFDLSFGELQVFSHDALHHFAPFKLLDLFLQFDFLLLDPVVLTLGVLHTVVSVHASDEILCESSLHRRHFLF